ncbi:hypothetical protein K470DRAFT_2999 [Piedraia hortae CBS 480.64]|uniref:Uncharacterized protein n=1 Tax=Piedraia hortae CBS 480.64 TaxID=1314780 RepID=A0A6A7CAD6_9PEZI|nr:hypothetical protein K470DRAFT_2999 [Piedraia hortae CBS 480.64]
MRFALRRTCHGASIVHLDHALPATLVYAWLLVETSALSRFARKRSVTILWLVWPYIGLFVASIVRGCPAPRSRYILRKSGGYNGSTAGIIRLLLPRYACNAREQISVQLIL